MSDPKLTPSDVIRDYLSRLDNHSNVNPDFSSESEDVSSCVVLSVICLGSKIGAAYFDFDQEHLHLMPDRSLTPPSYTFLHLLLKQAEPTYIITSCKTDQNVLGILKEHICPNSTSTITSSTILRQKTDERLHLLPNLDFALEACKHRLQKLQLPGLPENMNEQERKIHFSTLVDFTSICMVKAAGGLLKFIENNHFSKNLDSSAALVMTVSNLSLKNILNMDEISYRSLQIFQEERHPSVYKSTFGTKEGLSLYGICNKCKSAIGKKELRRWFLFPSSDLSLIKERQEGIKFFLSERNMELKHTLQQSLKNIKFIPRVLLRMKTAQATLTDWQSLLKTAYHGMLIGNICHSKTSELKIFEQIDSSFSNDLFRISSLLDKIIDFEEYLKQNRFVVKPGVDDELDKMKRTYHGLPDFMTQIAYKELQDLPADVEHCTVIYLPQMGYLLAIPLTKQMKDTKNYDLPNLKYMFIVNDVAHYKSINTRKLDSVLGDTLCDIYDKETQIMHKLQNVILEMKHVLFDVMKYSAELDCLIALAVAAKEFNWVQPEIASDGELLISKGRHPLLELCVASYVPNDICSGGSASKVKVVTGANSSGKSMYIQQIALICFLAHLGSFVPAESAHIPILDSIFTCSPMAESISLGQSSFLLILNQISSILNNATASSLVIIDEFGKHTDKESGLSLLCSSLEWWSQKGPASPHILLATHFLSIRASIANPQHIHFQTMELLDNDGLVFLYQVVDGTTPSSFAAFTALGAGLDPELVARGYQISEYVRDQQAFPPRDTIWLQERLKWYTTVYNQFIRSNLDSDEFDTLFASLKDSVNTPSATSSSRTPYSASSSSEQTFPYQNA